MILAVRELSIKSLVFHAIVGILVFGGCSAMKGRVMPAAEIEGVSGRFYPGTILNMSTGRAVSFETLVADLGSEDVIFIGEVHDNPEHHLIQVQLLQALTARYAPVTVGMEFFEAPRQEILDRYTNGVLTEEEFLARVEWGKTWGYPYRFYRPLIQEARQSGSRLLALNAPRFIVKKVARSGLKSLESHERIQVAETIHLDDDQHRAFLREVYELHAHGELKEFDFFYQAQCVWEDTMAENLVKELVREPRKAVVFSGNGHIVHGFGIPDRTRMRLPVTTGTLILHPLTAAERIEKETADFVWLTGTCSRRHPPVPAD